MQVVAVVQPRAPSSCSRASAPSGLTDRISLLGALLHSQATRGNFEHRMSRYNPSSLHHLFGTLLISMMAHRTTLIFGGVHWLEAGFFEICGR